MWYHDMGLGEVRGDVSWYCIIVEVMWIYIKVVHNC